VLAFFRCFESHKPSPNGEDCEEHQDCRNEKQIEPDWHAKSVRFCPPIETRFCNGTHNPEKTEDAHKRPAGVAMPVVFD